MLGFGITSWLVISVIVVARMITSIMKSQVEKIDERLEYYLPGYLSSYIWTTYKWLPLHLVVLLLLAGQLWTFFRLQRFQRDMVRAAGGDFVDGQWSFGQIVSVVVFIPTIVEVIYFWRRRALYLTSKSVETCIATSEGIM